MEGKNEKALRTICYNNNNVSDEKRNEKTWSSTLSAIFDITILKQIAIINAMCRSIRAFITKNTLTHNILLMLMKGYVSRVHGKKGTNS